MRLLLLFFFSVQAFAQTQIPVEDRMATYRFLVDTYASVYGKTEEKSLSAFVKALSRRAPETRELTKKLIAQLDPMLPKEALLPIVYWRTLNSDDKKLTETLMHLMVLRMNAVRDFVDQPLEGTPAQKNTAKQFLSTLYGTSDTLALFETAKSTLRREAQRLARLDQASFGQAVAFSQYLTSPLPIPKNSQHSDTYLGFIPGNLVQLLSHNDVSAKRIDWFNQRLVFGGGQLDFTQPYMKMPTDQDPSGHVVFQEDPIYQRIRSMIDAAQDSVFIDIFLFGGTLGGTLAKHLIDQAELKMKKNPNFRVLLLHDFATNYNMKEEMMPVFEYIRDRIAKDGLQDHFYLVQANIQRHPPGIPFGLTGLIPKTDEVFKEIEKRNTYFESKIDHSKVIVVDANTEHPKAYFGSKNWTDHSGGYYYDNTLYIEGPAAALVQASYYDDIDAALTTDEAERKWFFYKDQGFGNDRYLPSREKILAWFKITRSSYPAAGAETVRLAEGNVDGKIKDVRNMLIDRISKAKRTIYMEQLFLYDPYVVDALIKRKLQLPGLDVKIIVDHNRNFGMNGLPNTLFLREMERSGIEIRARRTLGTTVTLKNGETRTYNQENHRKITAVDGEYLMVGSANINPDTLQGSFREFGAEIFDKREIKDFESEFMSAWYDEADPVDGENIQLVLLGKPASAEVSRLVNDLGAMIFRSKDRLEHKN